MGEGWAFFKGKGWINKINKAWFLCLSSALPVSLLVFNARLNVSLTAKELSRKYTHTAALSTSPPCVEQLQKTPAIRVVNITVISNHRYIMDSIISEHLQLEKYHQHNVYHDYGHHRVVC